MIDMLKLIGSKTEAETRKQLVESHRSLFNSESKKNLRALLRVSFPWMKTAYVINWIPEQGEDIFEILIDCECIAVVEMDRINPSVGMQIEKISINTYLRGLKKIDQIRLAVAIDLAKKDIMDWRGGQKIDPEG